MLRIRTSHPHRGNDISPFPLLLRYSLVRVPFKKVLAVHSLTSASKSPSKRKRSETNDDDSFQDSPIKHHSPASKALRRRSSTTLNEKLKKLKGKISPMKPIRHTLPTSSVKK